MTLKEQLLEDLKTAMRNKESLRKDLLQIVRAAILQVEKDERRDSSDQDIYEILAREMKKRQENIQELASSGREDILARNRSELALLEAYLPRQLSAAELEQMIVQAITETNARSARDIGTVMQKVLPQVRGRADGKQVNLLVRKHLGN